MDDFKVLFILFLSGASAICFVKAIMALSGWQKQKEELRILRIFCIETHWRMTVAATEKEKWDAHIAVANAAGKLWRHYGWEYEPGKTKP